MKYTTLSEFSIKIGINKSKLMFYYKSGLLKPVMKIGKTNVFDEKQIIKALKKIESSQNKGMSLKEIRL